MTGRGEVIGADVRQSVVELREVADDGAATDDPVADRHASRQEVRSPHTTRAYRSAVHRFETWCAEQGHRSRPADPEVVAAFLAAADADCDGGIYRYSASTLSVWSAAIRRDHLDADLPDPVSTPVVRTALRSMAKRRSAAGQVPERADALLVDDLRALVDSISARAAEGDWKTQIAACRDIALIVVGFCSARRRSEIAAIQFGDLRIVSDEAGSKEQWITMRIRGSRTSLTSVAYAQLPRSRDSRYCPWCRLLDWLMVVTVHDNTIRTAKDHGEPEDQQVRAARRSVIRLLDNLSDRDPQLHHCDRELPVHRRATAPVWRALAKSTRYLPADTGHPLTDQTIPLILKKRCQEAGFDSARIARISGHSLRSGFITQARADGIASEDIKRQSGHKRTDTVDHYYDSAPSYHKNAANQLQL